MIVKRISFKLLTLITIILYITGSGYAQWKQIPEPYGGSIQSVVISGNQLFAGGGNLYVSNDYGHTWEIDSAFPGHSISVLLVKNNSIFAVTGEQLYRSDDQGQNWVLLNFPASNGGIILLARMNSTLIACTNPYHPSSGFYRSEDNGETWTLPAKKPPEQNYRGIFPIGQTIYACGYNGIYQSIDEGLHWEVFSSSIIISSVIVRANNRLIVAKTGYCLRSYDGVNWDSTMNNLAYPTCMLVLDSINGGPQKLLMGTGTGLFMSGDDGTTWDPIADVNRSNGHIYYLIGADSSLFAATSSDGILRSFDKGSTWKITNSGIKERLYDFVTASGKNVAVVEQNHQAIFVSTDRGLTWKFQGIEGELYSGWVNGVMIQDDWLFVSSCRGLYRKKITDPAWERLMPDSCFQHLAKSGNLLYAATWWVILKSEDHGESWKVCNQGKVLPGALGLSANGNTVITVADIGGVIDTVMVSTDMGEHFQSTSIWFWFDEGLAMTHDSSAFYITSSHGIYRSANDGAFWELVSDTSLWYFSTMTADAGHLYISTRDGVIRSGDRGHSWIPYNEGLPGHNVFDIAIAEDTLYVIGSSSYAGFGICKRSAWPVGIGLLSKNQSGIRISPNPIDTKLRMTIQGWDNCLIPYCIYDTKGSVQKNGISNTVGEITVEDLIPGMYLLYVSLQNRNYTIPFIKK